MYLCSRTIINGEIRISMRALIASVKKISGHTPTETEGHHETYKSGYRVKGCKIPKPVQFEFQPTGDTTTSTRSMYLDS